MLESPKSSRCPVKTLENYLKYLDPAEENLFQRPRPLSGKFNPDIDQVWFCQVPVGQSVLISMMKSMSQKAGIEPHLTNHCVRVTSVTVLSDNNVEARHIKAVTDHKSDQSIESYSVRPSFRQKENMSNILSRFISSEEEQSLVVHDNSSILSSKDFSVFRIQSSVQQSNQKVEIKATNNFNQPQPFNFHNCSVSIVNNYR